MSGQLKKTELIAVLAEAAGVDKKDAKAMVDALPNVINSQLQAGNAVTIAGFGKIAVRERAARTVRNPATGETMQKPADKVVKFTIAKALKDAIN